MDPFADTETALKDLLEPRLRLPGRLDSCKRVLADVYLASARAQLAEEAPDYLSLLKQEQFEAKVAVDAWKTRAVWYALHAPELQSGVDESLRRAELYQRVLEGERYGIGVRLRKLEELARDHLGWDDLDCASDEPVGQLWWRQLRQSQLHNLVSILNLAEKLIQQRLTLRHSLAELERASMESEEEPVPLTNLLQQARLHNAQGQFEAALVACSEALCLDPASAVAFNNRGFALVGLGRSEEGLISCNEALWLEPALVSAHINRGGALVSLRRFEEALAAYDHALWLRPDLGGAIETNRGEVLLAQGRLEESLAACNRAISHEPSLAAPQGIKGIVLHIQGKYQEAAASFAAADRLAEQGEPVYLLFRAVSLLAVAEDKAHREGLRLLANNRLNALEGERLIVLRTYQFLHALSRTGQRKWLREVHQLLLQGLRFPPDWRLVLAPNVTQAIAAGHEDGTWLFALADVLYDLQPLDTLDSWPAWAALSAPAP